MGTTAEKLAEEASGIRWDLGWRVAAAGLSVERGRGWLERGSSRQREELIGSAIESQQVEFDELSTCLLKLGRGQAHALLDTLVAPEAEAPAVGGQSQMQVEELGRGGHHL